MNFKNIVTTSVLACAFLAAPAFSAPSAKFTAHVAQSGANTHLLHSGVAMAVESGVPVSVDDTDKILEATIHSANKKDLLIGVSLQSGLYTDTTVKGKNGSSEKAGAMAGIKVHLEISGLDDSGNPAKAYPESVVYASRVQELSATLGGVIESCTVNLVDEDGDGIPDSGEFVVARDCEVSDEEIGLMISTTSANHFNFVVPNLAAGDHTVKVWAEALASAEFTNGTYCPGVVIDGVCTDADGNPLAEVETTNNEAKAWALVDVGSLTVEAVRATNTTDGINIDLDI